MMAVWLILDSNNTVVNVLDDLNGKAPPVLESGQTKLPSDKHPSAWAGWRLDPGLGWQDRVEPSTRYIEEIKKLPADQIALIASEISK